MKKLTVLISMVLLFGLTVMMSSCTIAKISGKGSMPLLLNNPPEKVKVISHFTESKMITFDYTSSFDVYEIIADRLANSDADMAINLTITIKSDVGTFFVNLFTLGLANARTVQVEGDFVKKVGGMGALLKNHEVLGVAANGKELKDVVKRLAANGQTIRNIVRQNGKFLVLN